MNLNLIFWDVDTQGDFMLPEGKLYVTGAERIIPTLARLTNWAAQHHVLVVASADAHQPDDEEFSQYPPHCLAGTPGQKKIPETLLTPQFVIPNRNGAELPDAARYQQIVVEKQKFDVFTNPNTEAFLARLGKPEIVLYGVVTEICVSAAGRGLLERGYRVTVVEDAIRHLDPEKGRAFLEEVRRRGGRIVTAEQLLSSIITSQVDPQTLSLGRWEKPVEERLSAWQRDSFVRRMWAKDYTLWSTKPVPELTDRMGWLTLPETMHEQVPALVAFADRVRDEGFRHVVLLGMGGSSLAPEVFQRTFGNVRGRPELIVLDSTHPGAVRAVESRVDLRKTLFLVSSKSGTTTETSSFFHYFWQRLSETGKPPGPHFVAITDPGSSLEKLAEEREFRATFPAPVEVGGRYSALSVFGLVPAALIGVDIRRLLDAGLKLAESCAFCVPEPSSAPLRLGAAMGELALAGRDKVTFLASPSLEAFPVWAEQLIAESTGKDDKGIVPVADEPLGAPGTYGNDRFFAILLLEGDSGTKLAAKVKALEAAGHPVAYIQLRQKTDLGQEFFRWEVAVAAAGAVLGIQPFNQPDVQLAKELAKKAMASAGSQTQAGAGADLVRAEDKNQLSRTVDELLSSLKPGNYISIQAYLNPTSNTWSGLQQIRTKLRDRTKAATTLGFGPRFLHSTGQLHKGGPNTGVFLQIVDEPAEELLVPETNYSFAQLIRAQAEGDYQALKQRGRRVLRVHLGRDTAAGLRQLAETLAG